MFFRLLGKKKSDSNPEVAKIMKMNLTDLRLYLNSKIEALKVTEDGLAAVVKRLVILDETTKKYYIEASDTDQKKKKAFEVFLLLAKNKKMNIKTVELMQEFILIYADIIKKYDIDFKEIYESKLLTGVELALSSVQRKTEFNNRIKVLEG